MPQLLRYATHAFSPQNLHNAANLLSNPARLNPLRICSRLRGTEGSASTDRIWFCDTSYSPRKVP